MFQICLEGKIVQIIYVMVAILNGSQADVCANGNIDFWIPHALRIPKTYSYANPHKPHSKKKQKT